MWVMQSQVVLVLVVVIVSLCSSTQNSTTSGKKLKVLGLFPHSGYSHFVMFEPLVKELARRGHDVTVISYFPRSKKEIAEESLPTYKDIDLRNDKYNVFLHAVNMTEIPQSFHKKILYNLDLIRKLGDIHCTQFYSNQNVKQFFDAKPQFDVLITEAFNTYCTLASLYYLNAPLVLMSSHQLTPWAMEDLGIPQEASYMPSIFSGMRRPLSFFNRLSNLISVLFLNVYMRVKCASRDMLTAEKHGLGLLDLNAINGNASLMLTNTHYVIHGAAFHPHNVIEVGGIHVPKVVKPLPKNIAKFLDEAHEGVLYFNLGSLLNTATVADEKQEMFLKVFSSLPKKVLWKWQGDVENLPSNVMIQKWLPQYDILNHPNVKCFFTHGGLMGLTESVKSGVPMIVLPMFGDQHSNAFAIEHRGAAIVLRYDELTEEIVRHAIDELFNNTKYRENAKALSKAFSDRPMHPLDEAVWWVEYVARGNGRYLISEGARLPWYQYYYVDIWAFLIVVTLVFLYTLYTLTKRLLSLSRKFNGEMATKSKKKD